MSSIKYIRQYADGTNERVDNKPSWGMYEATKANDDRDVYIGGKWYSASNGNAIYENNGTDTSNFTTGSSTLSVDNSTLLVTPTATDGYASIPIPLEIGKKYIIKLQAVSISEVYNRVNISTSGYIGDVFSKQNLVSGETITAIFIASTTYVFLQIGGGNIDKASKWDNISVYATEPTLGTPYTNQFTYAGVNGKLLGIEVANGEPVDIHLEDTESNEVAPDLYLPAIQSDVLISKTIRLNSLPTVDPLLKGEVWNDSGVLKISAGV